MPVMTRSPTIPRRQSIVMLQSRLSLRQMMGGGGSVIMNWNLLKGSSEDKRKGKKEKRKRKKKGKKREEKKRKKKEKKKKKKKKETNSFPPSCSTGKCNVIHVKAQDLFVSAIPVDIETFKDETIRFTVTLATLFSMIWDPGPVT